VAPGAILPSVLKEASLRVKSAHEQTGQSDALTKRRHLACGMFIRCDSLKVATGAGSDKHVTQLNDSFCWCHPELHIGRDLVSQLIPPQCGG
jgi:hypothetical protein